MKLEKLSFTVCQPWLNTPFNLVLSPEVTLQLTLIDVQKSTSYRESLPVWRDRQALRKEPFSLVFRGPIEPVLNQGMYSLYHEQIGTIENIFLVPIDADGNGRYYEAVFN